MMNPEPRVAADVVPGVGAPAVQARRGPESVRVDVAGLTSTGKKRSVNEDHYVIASFAKSLQLLDTSLEDRSVFERLHKEPAHLLVVADGVGGKDGGEVASSLTVETIAEYLGGIAGCYNRFDVDREHEFLDHLSSAVEQSHVRLREEFPSGRSAASTVTMAAIVWPRAYLVHVGDTRAYYLRRGNMRQITQDQTVGDFMVNIGALTEADARERGLFNVLASAVGSDLTPAVGLIDLEPDDVLLLCSDGLTKHVSDERISELLATSPSAQAACQALVDAAMEDGGSDNITVVAARFTGGA
jgi:protein phosphatase